MAFVLRVEFVGVCLFVQDEAGSVAVVMPDGRTGGPPHADNQPWEAHVGFMRWNLSNLAGAPTIVDPGPSARPIDVVYRFRRQTLHFGLGDDPVGTTLEIPIFDQFAPGLRVEPSVFARHTPTTLPSGVPAYHPVLMRTKLSGGTLETPNFPMVTPASAINYWDPAGPPVPLPNGGRTASATRSVIGRFYSSATWLRTIEANELIITLTDLDGGNPIAIRLTPRPVGEESVIDLQMGNLCSDNPLAWEELQFQDAAIEDVDFRFLYRLFQPPGSNWVAALSQSMLPAPRLVRPGPPLRGRPPVGCGGGKVSISGRLLSTREWDGSAAP